MTLVIPIREDNNLKVAESILERLLAGNSIEPISDLSLIDELILLLRERGIEDVQFTRFDLHPLSLEQAYDCRYNAGLDIR